MDLITNLANNNGLLGLLLALALVAIVYLYRDNKSLNQKFIDLLVDNINTSKSVQQTIDAFLSKVGGGK